MLLKLAQHMVFLSPEHTTKGEKKSFYKFQKLAADFSLLGIRLHSRRKESRQGFLEPYRELGFRGGRRGFWPRLLALGSENRGSRPSGYKTAPVPRAR